MHRNNVHGNPRYFKKGDTINILVMTPSFFFFFYSAPYLQVIIPLSLGDAATHRTRSLCPVIFFTNAPVCVSQQNTLVEASSPIKTKPSLYENVGCSICALFSCPLYSIITLPLEISHNLMVESKPAVKTYFSFLLILTLETAAPLWAFSNALMHCEDTLSQIRTEPSKEEVAKIFPVFE